MLTSFGRYASHYLQCNHDVTKNDIIRLTNDLSYEVLTYMEGPSPLKPVREQSAIKSANTGKEELLFVSFCIEMYARRHGMDGGDVFRLFDEKGVCDFLVDCYDPLHSQGREYILDEIELFMKGASNNAKA